MTRFENIPPLLKQEESIRDWEARRKEWIDLIAAHEYGSRPEMPYGVHWEVQSEDTVLDGRGKRRIVEITVSTALGSCHFPLYLFLPEAKRPCPAVLLICSQNKKAVPVKMPAGIDMSELPVIMKKLGIVIDEAAMGAVAAMAVPSPRPLNLAEDLDNGHWPVPSVLERGYAAAAFYASDIDADDAEQFPAGLAKIFGTGRQRGQSEWGLLAVWAFAAQCAMDYLVSAEELDPKHIAITGHSRCGKAALWAGACDTRFHCVMPNNSGCSGAALARGKHGENLASINLFFPHWFAPAYARFSGRPEALPFDQHHVLSLVAPRALYVTSASEDLGADPVSEHMSAVLASQLFAHYGGKELPQEMPHVNTPVYAGPIGYHLREGGHLLTRYDWMCLIDHMERNP